MLRYRGIRGATTVEANTADAILSATRELLSLLVQANQVAVDDITSVFFTLTDDLDAVYPALAARQIGWDDVALLCAREIPVPDAQNRCVRVLLHVNTEKHLEEIRHVYLRDAVHLRPTRAHTFSPATLASSNSKGDAR
jgi:chorismate mutase